MKKLLYVFLAITMAFAMVACGNSTGGSTTVEKWVVTWDANGWEGAMPAAATVEVEKGSAIGTLPTLTDTDTQKFMGWSATSTGTLINAAWKPEADCKLYVIWEAKVAPGDPIVITYNANGWTGEGVPTVDGAGTSGELLPGSAVPALTDTATQKFLGWALTPSGSVIDVATYKPDSNITLYVRWQSLGGEVVDPSNFVERVALMNDAFVIYEFTLPEGATFGDYVGLSFDVKVENPENGGASTAPGYIQVRAARLYGAYTKADFWDHNNEGDDLEHFGGGAYIAEFGNNGKNGGWIAGQKARWGELTALGFDTSDPDAYFTIEWELSGEDGITGGDSSKGGNHWPDASATGPFYFGLGISGNQGPIVQSLKNIKLIGNPEIGIDDVYSITSGFDAPAFAGYVTGGAFAKYSMIGDAWRDEGDTTAAAPVYLYFNDTNVSSKYQWAFEGETYTQAGLTLPAPSNDGFILEGWYTNDTFTTQFSTTTALTTNTVLYGKWEVDPDYGGPIEKSTLKKISLPTAPNWINANNQWGWGTTGADGVTDATGMPAMADIAEPIYLELKTEKIPTGGGTTIWGNNVSGWRQNGAYNGVFGNDGTPNAGTGVTIEGDEDEGYVITIDMSKAFIDFDAWEASTWVRFGFGVYWGEEGSRGIADAFGTVSEVNLYVVERYDLGAAPTWINSRNQWGWATAGASANDGWFEIAGEEVDEEDLPAVAIFARAEYLVLETTKIPTGGGTVVWGNQTNGWRQSGSWNGVFGSDGTPVAGRGVTITGSADDGYVITFKLSDTLENFTDWAASEWIRFCFGVSWGNDPGEDEDDYTSRGPDAAFGIKKAYFKLHQ